MQPSPRSDETLDDLLGGRMQVLQKAKGYRFSLDALLLAHFVRLRANEQALEMGTGSGVISLILSRRWEGIRITGIDIQTDLIEMAGRSVMLNGLDDKIQMRHVDVKEIKAAFPPHSFDVVIANPPYRKVNSGRVNPNREKATARHELGGDLRDFLRAAGHVLKPAGRAYFIYPASRLVELLSAMREARLEPKRLRMVHSRVQTAGQFLLTEGLREGREELEIMPPLFIFDEKSNYTEGMVGIFKELSAPGIFAR